jgi:hypothetical protein
VNDLLGGIGQEIAMHTCASSSLFFLFLFFVAPFIGFAEHDREILHGDFPDNV